MRLRPLPDRVVVGAHSRRALAEVGVRRGELAGPRWRRVGRDAYAWAGTDPACRQRVLEAAEQLPSGCAITGWAAAWLLGARDLDCLGRDGRTPQRVPLVVLPGARARRGGLTTIRSALTDEEILEVEGVPVIRPSRTASSSCDPPRAWRMRSWVSTPCSGTAWCRRTSCTARCGGAGGGTAWARPAGPRPSPTAARAPRRRAASGLERHTHDNQREEWMEDAGLAVTRATSIDLGPRRQGLVGRLRAAHARAMARDASTRRWRLEGVPWH